MKTKSVFMNDLVKIILVVGALLMIPLVGMKLGTGFNWTLSDFIIMGTLLTITGVFLEIVYRNFGKYKIPAVIIIVFLFLWLWEELAVGLFTNWGS